MQRPHWEWTVGLDQMREACKICAFDPIDPTIFPIHYLADQPQNQHPPTTTDLPNP